jgi:MFS family permease
VSTAHTDRLPRAFWRLFGAASVANFGDGIQMAAMPLLAARLTRDATSVAAVATFGLLPWLLLSVVAGAVIDRTDRRRLMVIANGARIATMVALAVTAATGHASIPVLCVAAFVLTTGELVFDNASQAVLPTLVAAGGLERANGRLQAAQTVMNGFAGVPFGALLITWAVGLPFAANAICFAVASLLVRGLPGSFVAERADPGSSMMTDLRAGFAWLRHHRVFRSLAVAVGLSNFGFAMGQAILVLLALERLGISERGYGLLIAVIAVGATGAGLASERVVRVMGRRRALTCAVGIWAVSELSIGLFPNVVVLVVSSVVASVASVVWTVVSVSVRQQRVPDELLGRVNAIFRWAAWGPMPVGAFVGGVLAQEIGLRAPFIASGTACAAAFVVVALGVRGDQAAADLGQATPRTPAPPSMT